MTVLIGGFESMLTTVCFALYESAINEDYQTRLQFQIDSICEGSEFDMDHLESMSLLQNLLKGTTIYHLYGYNEFRFSFFLFL